MAVGPDAGDDQLGSFGACQYLLLTTRPTKSASTRVPAGWRLARYSLYGPPLTSFVIQPSAGGFSLSELLSEIEARIALHDLLLKLRTVVADTLGRDMQSALGWSFDLARSTASMRMYDTSE